MDTTRASLLMRIKDRGDDGAWQEFVALYRPLLTRYVRCRGLGPTDAEDVAQECLAVVARKMPGFNYDRRKGGFTRWLRVVVRLAVRDHLRKRRERSAETGDFERPQHRERTPVEVWERLWLQEHLKYCLERIRPDFENTTFEAFQRCVIDEWPVEKVCDRLGMNANRVYIAKSRVGGRLREVMTELLGDSA